MRSLAPKLCVAAILAIGLGACSTLQNPGAPDQSFDVQNDIKELEEHFKANASIKSYYQSAQTNTERNNFIAGRLVLINIHYIEFIKAFVTDKAQLDSAFEITTIGVDLAITLVGGAAVKSILGAASGGLTASKASLDKNFFQEKTVPVLISEMNARRKISLIPILEGSQKPISEYSFESAVIDLQFYYEAGTFIGALQSIQKDAGVKETKADKDISNIRSEVFGDDENTKFLESFMGWDGTSFTNAANVQKLKDWKKANGLEIVGFTLLLNAEGLADKRRKAIQHFNLRP